MEKTHVVMLLDESGSMLGHKQSVVDTFNEYVTKLKGDGGRIHLSLYKFDLGGGIAQTVSNVPPYAGGTNSSVSGGHWGGDVEREVPSPMLRQVFVNRKLSDLYALTYEQYQPRGMTPLLDAVGELIDQTRSRLPSKSKVLFVIHTDGQENSSTRFTYNSLKQRVGQMEEEDGWTFLYLGEGPSAWNQGRTFGIRNTSNFTPATRGATMQAFSTVTSSYASNRNVGGNAGSTQTLYKDAGVKADHTGGEAESTAKE